MAEKRDLFEDAEFHRRATDLVQQRLTATGVPGASIALLVDGQPLFASGVGYANLERTTPLGTDARFYIYSITKTLLATLILQLAEEGEISLDASVQQYLTGLPADPFTKTPITLRQLLNHTGGLPDYGGLPAYQKALRADPTQPWTDEEYLTNSLAQGMLFVPGEGWRYSNIGFMLLRQVIEEVRATLLEKAMQQQIFAPLDLQRTTVARTLEDASQLTPGYSTYLSEGKAAEDVHPRYHPGWVSHGVVISTAQELAHAMDTILTDQLITPQSRAAMLEPVLVPHQHPFFQQPAYGLGTMIDPQSQYGILAGHGGSGPGYSAGALHAPNAHGHRITSIVLANSDQGDIGLQTAFELLAAVGELLAE